VFKTIWELYDFSFQFIVELREKNALDLADPIDRALAGTTSGEILTYLGVAYAEVVERGFGDERVHEALRFIDDALKPPPRWRR
jgi:hypothetical protein